MPRKVKSKIVPLAAPGVPQSDHSMVTTEKTTILCHPEMN